MQAIVIGERIQDLSINSAGGLQNYERILYKLGFHRAEPSELKLLKKQIKNRGKERKPSLPVYWQKKPRGHPKALMQVG